MTRDEFKQKYMQRRYLGDGLYVEFDGYQIMLIAPRENGEHMVALEPEVFNNLLGYRKELYQDAESIKADSND